MSPSTSHPEAIPEIPKLRLLTQSLAILDAIICPEWELRYYSFNSRWGPDEEMASMRNGSGDEWFLLFAPCGAAMKGSSHECGLSGDAAFVAHIQSTVPGEFKSFLQEPAFAMEWVTFCLWRRHTDPGWNVVVPPGGLSWLEEDGSRDLLDILDGDPKIYHSFAEEYYERPVSFEAVQAIYEHKPLTEDLISALNPDISLSDIVADAEEIGYPETPSQ
jgi:hypothetical protein